MKIRFGYELVYECPQPTPMILTLNLHFSRVSDLLAPDHLIATPSIPIRAYRDAFGNWCSRIVAPPGELHLCTSAVIDDSGEPDVVAVDAQQHAVEDLPDDCIVFLLGSRYCETDRLTAIAWDLFDKAPTGWGRVQAICDFVHDHITFGYEHARPTKTAWEVFHEKAGVCRDFAHLAIAFCRCMNIPARYCTGYLGDIGIAPTDAPMDFHGWLEAYLGGHWYTFDPRNKVPRIGRLLIACGRDAADVAISTTFGPNTLKSFKVWTDPIPDANPTLSTVAIEESISMQKLTSDGQQRISDLAQRYGVSTDAVTTLLQAVVNGNGTMAQFYHQELGGGGQWMQGGMTMVGDMFNSGLKYKVDGLCTELSNLLASQPFVPTPSGVLSHGGQQQQQQGYGSSGGAPVSLFIPSAGGTGNWWPGEFGVPNASGAQNHVRYAYFAGSRRLAVEVNGQVSVYDTLDHQIGGVSQQQGAGTSVTFTSQYGVVSVLNLPIISGPLAAQVQAQVVTSVPQGAAAGAPGRSAQEGDIFAAIERLADLRQKGILTDQEFATKKADLLGRL